MAYAVGVCVGFWYAVMAWAVPLWLMPWFWKRCGCDEYGPRLEDVAFSLFVWLLSPLYVPLFAVMWIMDQTDTWGDL